MSLKSPEASTTELLVDQLYSLRQNKILDNDKSRKVALGLARELVSKLEDPLNVATDMMFSPCIATTAKIAVDLNLYKLITDCVEPSITTEDLSKQSGGQAFLISRVLRLLATVGFVEQVDRDKWTATPITKTMAQSPIMAGYRAMWDIIIPAIVKSPKYFRKTNFTCPTHPKDGIIQYTFQTQYDVFEYMTKVEPNSLNDFNQFMGNNMGARNYWVDWYPVKEKLIDGWIPNTALLVDVGGGKGHDIQAFSSRYPEASGALILQDLPQVIKNIQQGQNDTIERQAQDFFTPNQVQGARTYFLHHILHDWSDEYALKILSHIRDAMTPGYSKLLIHDPILPDTHASTFQAIYDITVMTFSGGLERDRSQWSELMDAAGFEIVAFWLNEDQPDADGIVEAVVKK